MAVKDQLVTDRYSIYNGDCIDVMSNLPDNSIHFSIYSPPFSGLYQYSSSPKDLSNCGSYEEFMNHYEFVVREIHRLTKPGRLTSVHCMDIPLAGANSGGGLRDFTGDIIRLHEKIGWQYAARYSVWKEPLGVRNRTMAKGLTHKQIVDDSTLCDVAAADYLIKFRKKGKNEEPVTHPTGLIRYAGERKIPDRVMHKKGWTGNQIENNYSHWIWRQYASAFWDDVRIDRVLPYKPARDHKDEKHVHPLQLDVIERAIILRTNPDDIVFTPFMGVGSEVYGALQNGRRAIGVELKPTYFRQAIKNLEHVDEYTDDEQMTMNEIIG